MRSRRASARFVGEQAEARFLAKIIDLGFTVSKPFGDCSPYDFIIEKHGRLHRVQVKSARAFCGKRYVVHTRRSGLSRYTRRQIDFVVAYVFPHDTWYVIPIKMATLRSSVPLYPHRKSGRSLSAPFREAWHLLLESPKPRRGRVRLARRFNGG
jgi:hypothetical protein